MPRINEKISEEDRATGCGMLALLSFMIIIMCMYVIIMRPPDINVWVPVAIGVINAVMFIRTVRSAVVAFKAVG